MGGAPAPTITPSTKTQVKQYELPDDVLDPEDSAVAALVSAYVNGRALELPKSNSTVHKEECVFSFDDAFCKTGLYINLSTFVAVGKEFIELDMKRSKTKEQLYLHVSKTYEEEEDDSKTEEPLQKKHKQEEAKTVQEYLKNEHENRKENKVKTEMRLVLMPSNDSLAYPYV